MLTCWTWPPGCRLPHALQPCETITSPAVLQTCARPCGDVSHCVPLMSLAASWCLADQLLQQRYLLDHPERHAQWQRVKPEHRQRCGEALAAAAWKLARVLQAAHYTPLTLLQAVNRSVVTATASLCTWEPCCLLGCAFAPPQVPTVTALGCFGCYLCCICSWEPTLCSYGLGRRQAPVASVTCPAAPPARRPSCRQ